MNVLILHLVKLLLFSAITNAIPIAQNSDVEGVSNITIQSCSDLTSVKANLFSVNIVGDSNHDDITTDSDQDRLDDLVTELNEATVMASNTLNKIKGWKQFHESKIKVDRVSLSKLQIPKCKHSSLKEEMNSRLHILEQLSNYDYFLMKQEVDPAYKPNQSNTINGTELINDLRIKMRNVRCLLRELIPITDNEIKNFAAQDVVGHLLSQDTTKQRDADKRRLCAIFIELMFDTLKQIKISANSVMLLNNI